MMIYRGTIRKNSQKKTQLPALPLDSGNRLLVTLRDLRFDRFGRQWNVEIPRSVNVHLEEVIDKWPLNCAHEPQTAFQQKTRNLHRAF